MKMGQNYEYRIEKLNVFYFSEWVSPTPMYSEDKWRSIT